MSLKGLRQKFLVSSLGLLSFSSMVQCSLLQQIRNPKTSCSKLEMSENSSAINAMLLLMSNDEGKLLLDFAMKNETELCLQRVDGELISFNARYTHPNKITSPEINNQYIFAIALYHEIFHELQLHRLDALKERLKKSNEPVEMVNIKRSDWDLYVEGTAYVAHTRFVLKSSLNNGAIRHPLTFDHNYFMFLEMQRVYKAAPETLSQEERLDIASLAAFKMFLESDLEKIAETRESYKSRMNKPDEIISVPVSELRVLTTMQNGKYSLYEQYAADKMAKDGNKPKIANNKFALGKH